MTENLSGNQSEKRKTRYWQAKAFEVMTGLRMHRLLGQLKKGPDSWRNIPEHCLVQVARAEVLGKWVKLPGDLISDMKIAAVLHDFNKKQEIEITREAEKTGSSPLSAYKAQAQESLSLLQESGFSERVIRFANSTGGHAAQLFETKTILDQEELSEEDLAYLICHYVDDCSAGSEWVPSSKADETGKKVNIIDDRAEGNKAKPAYRIISEEIGEELKGSPFEGMNNHDVMVLVSHQIEKRLAQRIENITGETVDPLAIPELLDQKIRQAITNG